MSPKSSQRVPQNTAREVNAEIRRQTTDNIARYAPGGDSIIQWRLDALDREWDIERTIEANASTLSLVGLILSVLFSSWFLLLPFAVSAFLLQHALQGWCPPVPILRRMGFRTRAEIDYERYALKHVRGDFDNLPPIRQPEDVAQAERILAAVVK